ncbi:MAG: T9SS type A sorting domain-containing protein [Ignavibacteriota bacterium]
MKPKKIVPILVFLALSLAYGASFAKWDKIKFFNDPIGCGYFFDADNGLLGSGGFEGLTSPFLSPATIKIFLTSDGGKTWKQAATPIGVTGRVTSISMKNRAEGYAAIYSRNASIFRTTDGGNNWIDFSQGNLDLTTCVYATSAAITKTTWFGNFGGSSTNSGRTYSRIFSSRSNGSNGVDFADDLNGVVLMGPGGGTWLTHDGGVTWKPGGYIPESWSVHALRGTTSFVALPEDGNPRGQTVYISPDGGSNWISRFQFSKSESFTGHIDGVGNTLYVQSDVVDNVGLFRSDDFGVVWNNVGGPSNNRDTRFVVTGCKGEVVYAFDPQGWVWKTIDGGDGSFDFAPRLGPIESKRAGDFARIPIYLDTTSQTFSISQFSGNLLLNTDLLSPVGFDTIGTLSRQLSFDTLYRLPDGSTNFLIKFITPIKNGVQLSLPLIYIKAAVYLSAEDTTTVTLGGLDINTGSSFKSLFVCSGTTSFFTLEKECGSTSIQQFMKTGTTPSLLTIHPNPSTADVTKLLLYLPEENSVTLDLIDAMGRVIRTEFENMHFIAGEHSLDINTSSLSNGSYQTRLTTLNGSTTGPNLVVLR